VSLAPEPYLLERVSGRREIEAYSSGGFVDAFSYVHGYNPDHSNVPTNADYYGSSEPSSFISTTGYSSSSSDPKDLDFSPPIVPDYHVGSDDPSRQEQDSSAPSASSADVSAPFIAPHAIPYIGQGQASLSSDDEPNSVPVYSPVSVSCSDILAAPDAVTPERFLSSLVSLSTTAHGFGSYAGPVALSGVGNSTAFDAPADGLLLSSRSDFFADVAPHSASELPAHRSSADGKELLSSLAETVRLAVAGAPVADEPSSAPEAKVTPESNTVSAVAVDVSPAPQPEEADQIDPASTDFFTSTGFVPAEIPALNRDFPWLSEKKRKERKETAARATAEAKSVSGIAITKIEPADREDAAPATEATAGLTTKVLDQVAAKQPSGKGVVDLDDLPPKVASPLGYKSKAKQAIAKKNVSQNEQGDDEDEDDDEDTVPLEEPYVVPPRRSFTDRASILTGRTGKGKTFPESDNEQGQEPEEQGQESPDTESSWMDRFAFLQQPSSLFTMPMSRLNKYCLISILTFVGFVFFSTCCSLVGSLGLFAAPDIPVNGEWEIATVTEAPTSGPRSIGRMKLHRKGNELFGHGTDNLGGGLIKPYQLHGEVKEGNHISFRKAYLTPDAVTGQTKRAKPYIQFEGTLGGDKDSGASATGLWRANAAMGAFIQRQMVEFSGEWDARQIADLEAMPEDMGDKDKNTGGWRWFWEDWPMHQKFLALALIAVCTILGILSMSFALFGPAGKMNIWEKQKYIPSQFRRQHNKMLKELSARVKPGGLPLGRRVEWKIWKPWTWAFKDLALTPEVRARDPHVLILGSGDKGKSRLIANMVLHDIESNDRAVCVVDSDGGLVNLITHWIASRPNKGELTKRVIVVDPTNKKGALGYNPLEMPEDGDLQSAASSIVYGFKAIYTEPPGSQSQWNAQTANILRNCALLLMANDRTLTDVPTLLNDNDFRDVLLEKIEQRKNERSEFITLLDTWGQYKKLARTDQWITWCEPILNRVSPMLGDARIRSILTKQVSDIRLRDVISNKKILLIKVPKGQLDQNANLLGSLIITGIKQAALSLANETHCGQNPIALYLDEFDNFIEKDTIEAITSETEKFKIGFIGAAKTLQNWPEDFRNQLVINVGTICCFALGKKDGDMLGPQMFRVDGRKIKHQTMHAWFNRVNAQPTFELITDEEKLNIDRVVGQETRTYFCYRVGTVAGVFNMRSHDVHDIPTNLIDFRLIDKMNGIKTPGPKTNPNAGTSKSGGPKTNPNLQRAKQGVAELEASGMPESETSPPPAEQEEAAEKPKKEEAAETPDKEQAVATPEKEQG
jgi:hypothetical protein